MELTQIRPDAITVMCTVTIELPLQRSLTRIASIPRDTVFSV